MPQRRVFVVVWIVFVAMGAVGVLQAATPTDRSLLALAHHSESDDDQAPAAHDAAQRDEAGVGEVRSDGGP